MYESKNIKKRLTRDLWLLPVVAIVAIIAFILEKCS